MMARGRTYDSSGRRKAARATRQKILDAAHQLLLRGGYTTMTIAELAAEAGVSPQTVYNAVGNKAEVLKAAYDVVLAGDDDELPMSQRAEFLAMADTPDAAAHARAYAAWTRLIYERVGPLLGALLAHAGADPALAAFAAVIEVERRTGNTYMVNVMETRHGLPAHLTRDRAIDMVWTLTAPELADRLMRRQGWTPSEYETWLGDLLVRSLT